MKKKEFRLMGFGHRIYKNYDPRADILREICHEVLEYLEMKNDPYMKIGMKLEGVALKDEYFSKRKLCPNVDFYSGILLRVMGLPMTMFTAIFALARTVGWVSHWLELSDEGHGIDRPRQLYIGEKLRHYPNKK